MSVLKNKIDFVAIISVQNANPNGDPVNKQPRRDQNNFGEISDVCIKRKIRNRMQELTPPGSIFVQAQDNADDGMTCLSDRAKIFGKIEDTNEYARVACEKWIDVRSFGQVFAFKSPDLCTLGVRGPVSIHQAVSVNPVEVEEMSITKCVNGEPGKGKGPDTMGTKSFVRFGLYEIKGSINVQLAEKTGFSNEDAELVKECLRTLFVNDSSSARPDGSMEVLKLYWFKHNCKEGQYSSAKIHRCVEIKLKKDIADPKSVDDYEITLNKPDDLEVEEIEGI